MIAQQANAYAQQANAYAQQANAYAQQANVIAQQANAVAQPDFSRGVEKGIDFCKRSILRRLLGLVQVLSFSITANIGQRSPNLLEYE